MTDMKVLTSHNTITDSIKVRWAGQLALERVINVFYVSPTMKRRNCLQDALRRVLFQRL